MRDAEKSMREMKKTTHCREGVAWELFEGGGSSGNLAEYGLIYWTDMVTCKGDKVL